MKYFDLDKWYGEPMSLELKPGMAWALYSDEGPGGICGQSMRITCPHSRLLFFASEQAMRDALDGGKEFRNGKKPRLMWGVIGDFTAGGVFRVGTEESTE